LHRGQSVKPFENAAFSQQVKVVGPVVETEFGYHIIQVLERNRPQQVALDKKIREEIASFIEQQKKAAAFEDIMKKLKAKATIIVHDNN
jgi:peptidyl-prolyl cis-trans isomerase C